MQFGNNAAVIVDDLRYTYENFSNKLKAVTDITSVASTATVGDFKDGNTTSNDYVYDDNGNLIVDLNKNIKNLVGVNGVTYNHLDKPVEIKIEGKGTVKITYDADGAKLKREFLNSTTNANKITWYLGEYQYEEVVGGPSPKALAVAFISFGEGRIRPITPRNESNTYDALQLDGNLTLPNGKKGSIDYFISDHRTDVRMILTEEKQWSYTTASMETASSRNTVEEGLFSTQVNLSRAPKTEVPGWTANTSQYVSKLNNTRMVGPNQMLKVMAGDLLHANVQYYYQQVAANSTGSTVFGSVLSMLGSSITGSAVTSAATKAASSSIIANLNTGLPFSQVISPDITSSTGNLPKAYLNVVFFDERFNFVSESSTSVRVGAANVAANLALTQIKAPENGYCYVYISNESTVSVYFDNLQVRHDRGRIVEENHYYAYGLRINAISSKAYGGPANNYLYQGDFAELDEDLGWTDFMLRSYDAEIGRFLQNDPYDEFRSGYVGMGNDPANLLDPTGGSTLPEFVFTVTVKTGSNLKPFMKVFQLATTVTTISINFTNIGSSTRDTPLPNVIGIAAHTALSDALRTANLADPSQPWIVNGILNNGLKPDVVNHLTKTVWELKPKSHMPTFTNGRFNKAVTQISSYVREINISGISNHKYVKGEFRAGGTFQEAPVYNGLVLPSRDNRFVFEYFVPDPSSGIIYYELLSYNPAPELSPAFSKSRVPQDQKSREAVPANTRNNGSGRDRSPSYILRFIRGRLPLILDGFGELLNPPLDGTKKFKEPI